MNKYEVVRVVAPSWSNENYVYTIEKDGAEISVDGVFRWYDAESAIAALGQLKRSLRHIVIYTEEF